MKKLLSIVFFLISLTSFGQTTPFSFTQINFSSADLNRPMGGAEQWNTANQANIPVQGTNTSRLDAYYRYQWYTIDTGTTSAHYNWSIFDAQINAAIDKGQFFSFGIMSTCPFCGSLTVGGSALQYPRWLHTAMQGEATKDWVTHNGGSGGTGGGHVGGSGGTNMWVPNWNSPSYLAAVKQFCIDLNTHLNNTLRNGVLYANVINYIDIRLYGAFGEWHSAFIVDNVNTGDYPAGTGPTSAGLDSIISYHVSGFPNQQLVGMIAAFDGQYFLNTWNPPDVGVYMLRAKNSKGLIGWRRDNWGVYPDWNPGGTGYINAYLELNTRGAGTLPHMKDSIIPRYKYAPIVGEPNNGGATYNSVDYGSMNLQVSQYHASSFGNGNYDVVPGANASGDTVRLASKTAGYRITPISGSCTTSPVTNGSFQINMNWQNLGLTPVYQNWNVTYQLVVGTTVFWTGVSSFQPFLFQPSGSSTAVTDNFTLSGVPAGTYTLKVVFKDPNGFRFPMPLFITGVNADGSYTLRTGIVITSSGAPVANAGPSQTITLPTSSVNLDGTASSGTITSYAWTQTSGPNTAVFGSPSASTSTLTGLIQGTYIIQLSLNSGVSTDTMTVTVNPTVPPGTNIFTTQTPKATTQNDGPQGGTTGIETGVKFQVSVAGYATGVRFYKTTAGNNGTHIGELYSYPGGARLAQMTFTGETSSGWQYVAFSVPVALTPNTTYVAAVFNDAGNYEDDDNYFTTNIVNTPVTGLASGGASGNNGVYSYTNSPVFPTSFFSKSNYWVDILFSPTLPNNCNCHPRTQSGFTKVISH